LGGILGKAEINRDELLPQLNNTTTSEKTLDSVGGDIILVRILGKLNCYRCYRYGSKTLRLLGNLIAPGLIGGKVRRRILDR
jgi:hypothetical protein